MENQIGDLNQPAVLFTARLLRRAENNRSAQKGFLNASDALKVDKDLQMRL